MTEAAAAFTMPPALASQRPRGLARRWKL